MSLLKINNFNQIREVIEKSKFSTDKYGDVVIFTNANSWYIPTLVKNLFESMKVHEPDRNLLILCTDQEGYDQCEKLGFEYYSMVDLPELGISSFKNLYTEPGDDLSKYTKLCFVKTVIMRYILEAGYTPLYIDPDMAFVKPGVEHLLSYMDTHDFVVSGVPNYVNTNIMLGKPSDQLKQVFQVESKHVENVVNNRMYGGDESCIMNKLLDTKINYICVDSRLYPGGPSGVDFKESKIVHANCVSGLDNKIDLLKKYKAWLI
jgi:hypothetical protein